MTLGNAAPSGDGAPKIVVPRRVGRYAVVAAGAIILVGLRGAIGTSGDAPPLGDHARYHDRTFRVARVIDGDTIELAAPDGDAPVTRVRLWGIDAPVMHFGDEARRYAVEALDGRAVHVVLAPHRTRGIYGRLLAYVHLERGGAMLNEILIERGLAYADPRFEHPYRRSFMDLEKRVRRSRAGLWESLTPEQMPEWRRRREAE